MSAAVSAAMKGNRRSGTRPEAALRSALHLDGARFRKDYLLRVGEVRTKADIVFTRHRVVVFVDGCFWHGCPEHGRIPRANRQYWPEKLSRNIRRDRRVTAALEEAGWRVVRVWEHVPLVEAVATVQLALSASAGEAHEHAA